jgi:diadenosine tetraphosphate (Ap4A) HIT family hydrolase
MSETMFDSERWNRLKDGSVCPMCSEATGKVDVVATLASGYVQLPPDGDFPGYCVLIYRRHVTELFDLDEVERCQMMEDVARIARAIQHVCKPEKINYAILGNEVPHLHCHIIPRKPDDGYWGRPIWARQESQKKTLSHEEHARLKADLAHAIAAEDLNEEMEEEME